MPVTAVTERDQKTNANRRSGRLGEIQLADLNRARMNDLRSTALRIRSATSCS